MVWLPKILELLSRVHPEGFNGLWLKLETGRALLQNRIRSSYKHFSTSNDAFHRDWPKKTKKREKRRAESEQRSCELESCHMVREAPELLSSVEQTNSLNSGLTSVACGTTQLIAIQVFCAT